MWHIVRMLSVHSFEPGSAPNLITSGLLARVLTVILTMIAPTLPGSDLVTGAVNPRHCLIRLECSLILALLCVVTLPLWSTCTRGLNGPLLSYKRLRGANLLMYFVLDIGILLITNRWHLQCTGIYRRTRNFAVGVVLGIAD